MANNTKNLANAIVAIDVGTSATTLVLEAGYGDSMPAVPFFLTGTPPGQLSTMGNSEIVLVTARTGDTLTIVRAQKLTSAKNIQAGWVVSNSVYVETSTQIGDIMTTLNATPRPGRLFMDGGDYNKADWPLLWQYVVDNPGYGTTSSTTFTLRDMRGRTQVGKSATGIFSSLAATMGAETHTLTTAQLPRHGFQQQIHGQENGTDIAYMSVQGGTLLGSSMARYGNHPTNPGSTSRISPGVSWGSNEAHNNIQPSIVVNYEVIAE